jgi:hypothetical protein
VLASHSPELESLGQGSRQLDLAVEPGEAEQLAGLAAVADHLEAAPVRGGAPDAPTIAPSPEASMKPT